MSEQEFSRWLCGKLEGHVVRMEVANMPGVPDINVCMFGHEFWIETKLVIKGRVLLRPFQAAWIRRRSTYGGRVFVIALGPTNDVLIYAGHFSTIRFGKYLAIASEPDRICPRKLFNSSLLCELLGIRL